jgi:hypothetical protein
MASITKDDELSSFDVPEIDRQSSSNTLYKIVLQVTPKDLTANSYQLVYWKRYNDIRKLYDALQRYHQAIYRPGKFPDMPPSPRFMERFDPAIAEERRIATKNFLNYALQHLYLRTHEAYNNFFQFRKVKKLHYRMFKQLHYNLKYSLRKLRYRIIRLRSSSPVNQ